MESSLDPKIWMKKMDKNLIICMIDESYLRNNVPIYIIKFYKLQTEVESCNSFCQPCLLRCFDVIQNKNLIS